MSLPHTFFIGRGGGGGIVATTFPMGHYDTGIQDYSNGSQWFSPNYIGIDIGTKFRVSEGTNIGNKKLVYRSTTPANHTWFLLIFEHTGGTMGDAQQQYTVRGGYRIDTSGQGTGTVTGPVLNTGGKIGSTPWDFTVPANKNYYLGFFSGSGNAWYSNGGALWVQNGGTPSQPYNEDTTASSIQYANTSQTSVPTINQVFTMLNTHSAEYSQFGLIV